MDYSKFLSDISKNRQPTILRQLFTMQLNGPEDWIYIIGGMPNPSLFPFESGTFKMPNGETLEISPSKMKEALQYGASAGYQPLLDQIKSLTVRLHNPPRWTDRSILATVGAQEGLDKAISMLINKGDTVLVEEPCYSSVLSSLWPFEVKLLPVETDQDGMKPDALRNILEARWKAEDVRNATKDFPKFLYTNPMGSNPTGSVLTEARRKEIYSIACEYNFLILEDDPYFLQFYLEDLPPSFLSLDTECRVLRFDSFSKTVAAGIRVGYVTAPKELTDRMVLHTQVSSQSCAPFSQVILSELLQKWGEDGFLEHSRTITRFYKQQRDAIVAAAEKYLEGLCEWIVPGGGLFMWIKVTCLEDTRGMLLERAKARKVVLVPGNAFMTDPNKPCPCIRVSFSFNTPEKLEKAMERLADLIRDEIQFNASGGSHK